MESDTSTLLISVVVLVLCMAILLVAVPSPTEKASWQTCEITAPRGVVFAAALTYLQDIGYALDTVDSANGFIKTQYASRAQLEGGAGLIVDLLVGEARYAVTVQVRAVSENITSVRVNLIAEKWVEGSLFVSAHWAQDPLGVGKADYEAFFTGLKRTIGGYHSLLPDLTITSTAGAPPLAVLSCKRDIWVYKES